MKSIPSGYYGWHCKYDDVNFCSNNEVNTGSTAVAQPTCQCPPGYMGRNCIDKCDSDQMCNNGVCTIVRGVVGARCECKHGYTGEYCERKSSCKNDEICLNGGACLQVTARKAECACPMGFYGEFCQFNNPCYFFPDVCGTETCSFIEHMNTFTCGSSSIVESVPVLLFALFLL